MSCTSDMYRALRALKKKLPKATTRFTKSCPRLEVQRVESLWGRCHRKLPAKMEKLADRAIKRFEERCGSYASLRGAKRRRRRR